jgi:hypothetical protein
MKLAVLGSLVGIGLVTAAVGVAQQRGEGYSQRTAPAVPAVATGNSEMVVLPTLLGDKSQVLTVVDPRLRVLGVYHIDLATGVITMKSVRNMQWDLQMSDFNNEKPHPQEIRSMLEPR